MESFLLKKDFTVGNLLWMLHLPFKIQTNLEWSNKSLGSIKLQNKWLLRQSFAIIMGHRIETATGGVLKKKGGLKILQFSQEITWVGVSFIKKRLQHRCFSVKFKKFLRIPILKNICERPILTGGVFQTLSNIYDGDILRKQSK